MTNKIENSKPLLGNDTNLISGSVNTEQAVLSKGDMKKNDNCSCDCWKVQQNKSLNSTRKLVGLLRKLVEAKLGNQSNYEWGDNFNVSGLSRELLKIYNRDGDADCGLSDKNIRKLITECTELLDND